ncbi:hypothetical protein [Arthrobacter sp. SO3]|uniref:hypothetical protein n=1 Tax=Arthrobacter sp. SO3 TaxID=1897057 RepID=UPI001CFFA6FE|nr:hypothetical protein [Arthrobacter sp. SO3]
MPLTQDSVDVRWTSEEREEALINSGIAAGYRGTAELALKAATADRRIKGRR